MGGLDKQSDTASVGGNQVVTSEVILGDCLEVMKRYPNNHFDLCLTDPPYGIGIANNPFRQKHKKSNWDDVVPSQEYFDEIFRVSKEQIIWGGNYFNLPPSRCFYVWDKVQPQNFSSAMCEMAWVSKQSPAKLFKQRVVSFEKFHPTTKPLNLFKWCLQFFPDAKTVIDPFCGSGTTVRAAKDLRRNCVGIEINPEYVDIINGREAQEVLL